MTRIIALAGLLVVLLTAYLLFHPAKPSQGGLQIKHRYLLVTVEGPPEWVENHQFSIRWQGQVQTLPVVFRVAGAGENMRLGALPEIESSLIIGTTKLPVQVEPATEFRVSNEFGVSFMPEPGTHGDVTALSIAGWVTVSPKDQPGKTSPMAGNDEFLATGKTVEVEVKKLLVAGRVIDVPPEQ